MPLKHLQNEVFLYTDFVFHSHSIAFRKVRMSMLTGIEMPVSYKSKW